MEKRLPLALLLSLLFIFWWQSRYAQPPVDPGAGNPALGGGQGTGEFAPGSSGPGDPFSGGAPSMQADQFDAGTSTVDLPPGEPVPFDGAGFDAEFNTRGATLTRARLREFRSAWDPEEMLSVLGKVDDRLGSFQLRDFDDAYGLERANWEVERGTSLEGRPRLVFTHRTDDGLIFTRTIDGTDRPYSFEMTLGVFNDGSEGDGTLSLVLRGPHGVVDEGLSRIAAAPPSAIAVIGGEGELELIDWSGDDLLEGQQRRILADESVLAVGAMTNYFVSVLAPHEGTYVSRIQPLSVLDRAKLELDVQAKNPLDESAAERWRQDLLSDHRTNASVNVLLTSNRPAPGERAEFGFTVYAGPRDRTLVGAPGFSFLKPIIEDSYGASFRWINKGLLSILSFFHGLTSNWGFAIILLTILVKALLFPLNRIQQSSMARYSAAMQKLKPQIDELKAKHKNNQKKFNEEQMKLLREHGISPPLGGCLLMFVQFPIWISLFQILRSSIDLRQAPFLFWVQDLSQPDRMPLGGLGGAVGIETLNLLPLLMAAAMVVQMKFTPTAGDEQSKQMQKVMGIFMPIMMLFFLYGYPSGLALYIFTSSLIGIFEYRVIRKFWPPPDPSKMALPKVKKAKKKGPALA